MRYDTHTHTHTHIYIYIYIIRQLKVNRAYSCDREDHGANKFVHSVSLLQLLCWKNMRDYPVSHASGSMVNRICVPSWNFDIRTSIGQELLSIPEIIDSETFETETPCVST